MPRLQLPLKPFAVGAWPLLISAGFLSLGIWFSESDAHGREFGDLLCSMRLVDSLGTPFLSVWRDVASLGTLALIPNEKNLVGDHDILYLR